MSISEIYPRRGIKRDCMMYASDTVCKGLNGMYCKYEICRFYKPKPECVVEIDKFDKLNKK